MLTMRKLAVASIAALGFTAIPALSAVVEYIEVQSAPPALQVETAPAPREGQVWIPGYWDYRDGSYSWTQGHFEPARAGSVYVAPRYVQTEKRFYAGRWESEEEHGGTRNRIRAAKDKVKDKIKGKDSD